MPTSPHSPTVVSSTAGSNGRAALTATGSGGYGRMPRVGFPAQIPPKQN
ncbi:MAG: hypothetical protein KDB61_01600 [Planctomycetes bacterium]|nr:hypothetical protein [Planctomycetota bacterium]